MEINEALQFLESDVRNDAVLELARDTALAWLVRRANFQHHQLAKVGAAVNFILKKNVVEGRRRPSPEQALSLGPDVDNLVTRTTWLAEFEAEWQKMNPTPQEG